MNIKKLVSAVSALTIAASAFAGLAVTASAKETVSTLTSKASYVSTTGGTPVATTTETGLVAYNTQFRDAASTALGTVKFNSNGTLPLYSFDISNISGTVTSATLTLTVTATNDSKDSYNLYAIGYNGGFDSLSNSATTRITDVLPGTATDTVSPFQPLDVAGTFNTGTTFPVNKEFSAVNYVASAVNAGNDTVNFAVVNNSIRTTTFATTATLTITTSDSAVQAGGITIKYVDSAKNEIADSVSVSATNKYVNDTYDYSYPAYITGTDGKLYKSNSDVYTATATFTADDQVIEVPYTVQAATVFQYVEYDGTTEITNVNKASNGAMTAGFGTQTLEVNTDGVYTVIFGTGRSTQESTSTRYGTWKVNDGDTTSVTFAAGAPGPQIFETVELYAGDIISVTQSNSKCALDYILIFKTGEIPVRVNAANLGAFEGTDGTVATAFKAVLGDVTGTLSFTVTPTEGDAQKFESATTVTDANVVLGIIIDDLNDKGATGVLTVE